MARTLGGRGWAISEARADSIGETIAQVLDACGRDRTGIDDEPIHVYVHFAHGTGITSHDALPGAVKLRSSLANSARTAVRTASWAIGARRAAE